MGITSASHIFLILLVVVIIFGASKLPQIGEGMGKAIKNFKRSVNEVEDSIEDITPPKKIAKSKEDNKEDA